MKALQDAIEKKAGQKIEAFEDVWKSLNQKSSIDEQEINTVSRGLIQPQMGHVAGIVKKLRANKSALADIDSVEKYLNAKHGLERNELMARRAADVSVLSKPLGAVIAIGFSQLCRRQCSCRNSCSVAR